MDIEGTAKACKNLEKLHMKMAARERLASH
jgi:hypothetical protein